MGYEHFFNPFCCKNKRIYYDCILQLIEKSKSVPLLYETDARDTLILYFRNCRYEVAEEDNSGNADENISSKKSETENAGAILRYFRHCGWISEREIGRNGDNIATVAPYCRKLIDAIERIFNRDNHAALTNHTFFQFMMCCILLLLWIMAELTGHILIYLFRQWIVCRI